MSDQLAAELFERLNAAKSKDTKHVFHRGWNAAIEFAIKQLKLAADEPIEDEAA